VASGALQGGGLNTVMPRADAEGVQAGHGGLAAHLDDLELAHHRVAWTLWLSQIRPSAT
jgi:hypothetical protein